MSAQDYVQLTLFPEDSPVSHSPRPGSDEARQMTATSGLKLCGLLKSSDPLGLLARTLLASSAWSSPARLLEWRADQLIDCRITTITRRYSHDRKTCCSAASSETLKALDTKSRHLLYRLVPSAPPTSVAVSQYWPTITATIADHGGPNQRDSSGRPGLQMALSMWPTPSASNSGCTALTPVLTKNGTIRHKNRAGTQSYARLGQVAAMFPTPKAQNARSNGERHGSGGPSLDAVAGGALNPDWVEWLMGFPTGWTDTGVSDITPERVTGWWDAEPPIPRVATGVQNRVGRLKCLGNAVVPYQFYPIFKAIADIGRATP